MNIIDPLIYEHCYFNVGDWEKRYGLLSVPDYDKSIPISMIRYMNEPCPFISGLLVKETHFLFYMPSELDGIALTINSMRRLLKGQSLLRFHSPIGGWFARHEFANFSETGSWKMLFAGTLPGSKSLTYKIQKRLFRQGGYTSPFTRTVVAMIILKAEKSNQILSKDEWGRSSESYDGGLRIRIGVFDEGAICISSRWSGRGYVDTGIFAEKIFY